MGIPKTIAKAGANKIGLGDEFELIDTKIGNFKKNAKERAITTAMGGLGAVSKCGIAKAVMSGDPEVQKEAVKKKKMKRKRN